MAFAGAVNAQLNGDLCVVLYQKRRAEGDVLHVVGTQLDLNKQSMKNAFLFRLQAIQNLALPHNRNTAHALEAAALKFDTHETSMTFRCK